MAVLGRCGKIGGKLYSLAWSGGTCEGQCTHGSPHSRERPGRSWSALWLRSRGLAGTGPVEDPLNWVLSKRDAERPTHVPASTAALELSFFMSVTGA